MVDNSQQTLGTIMQHRRGILLFLETDETHFIQQERGYDDITLLLDGKREQEVQVKRSADGIISKNHLLLRMIYTNLDVRRITLSVFCDRRIDYEDLKDEKEENNWYYKCNQDKVLQKCMEEYKNLRSNTAKVSKILRQIQTEDEKTIQEKIKSSACEFYIEKRSYKIDLNSDIIHAIKKKFGNLSDFCYSWIEKTVERTLLSTLFNKQPVQIKSTFDFINNRLNQGDITEEDIKILTSEINSLNQTVYDTEIHDIINMYDISLYFQPYFKIFCYDVLGKIGISEYLYRTSYEQASVEVEKLYFSKVKEKPENRKKYFISFTHLPLIDNPFIYSNNSEKSITNRKIFKLFCGCENNHICKKDDLDDALQEYRTIKNY